MESVYLQELYYCSIFELLSLSIIVGILLVAVFFKRW